MVRVDSLVPGKRYVVIRHRGFPNAENPWITVETFLGVTRPGDIYGRGAEQGLYKPLPPKVAKVVWAKYLHCKPSWKAIDDTATKLYRAGKIKYGDHPYLVFLEEDGKIGAPFYYYEGYWAWGSSANRVEFRELGESGVVGLLRVERNI